MVQRVTADNYHDFIAEREFAAIHFDAEWDVGHRPPTRRAMHAAAMELSHLVNFGEADIDADVELARRIGLLSVPLVAYYRRGELKAALIGTGQNVAARLKRLMNEQPIGYKDGTGFAPVVTRDQQR